MIEIERTFLAKSLPEDLKQHPHKQIIDIYIPETNDHPVIRIRKNGDKYEITKKEPTSDDSSEQTEDTINLTEEEFAALSQLPGKRVEKMRYNYPHGALTAEFDVFGGDLEGLVIVDFEFKQKEEADSFEAPDYCLADITQETFCAGGMIAGKKYADIESIVQSYGYEKLG